MILPSPISTGPSNTAVGCTLPKIGPFANYKETAFTFVRTCQISSQSSNKKANVSSLKSKKSFTSNMILASFPFLIDRSAHKVMFHVKHQLISIITFFSFIDHHFDDLFIGFFHTFFTQTVYITNCCFHIRGHDPVTGIKLLSLLVHLPP